MGASNIVRLLGEGLKGSEQFDLASGDALNVLPAVDDTGSLVVGNTTVAMDVKWYGTTATSIATFDAGNNKLTLAGVALESNSTINTSGTVTLTGAVNAANTTMTGFVNAANATFTTFVNSATGTFTNANAATVTATTAVNTVDINLTGELLPTANGAVYQKVIVANANCTLNAAHWGALVINKNAVDKIYTLPDANAALSGAWFEYASGIGQNTTFTANTANTILALNTLNANSVALNTTNEIIGATCKFVCDGTQWVFIPGGGTATIVD